MTTSDGWYQGRRSKERYVGDWKLRIGREAAETRWRAQRLQTFAGSSQLVWYPLLGVGLWNRWLLLILPGALLAGIAVIAFMLGLIARHRMYVLASAHTERKLNWSKGWRKLTVKQ